MQAQSGNGALLRLAATPLPSGAELTIFDGLDALPYFSPDAESGAPPAVTRWRAAIADSDALLVASPEYGHSLPGVLKNAIDWVIGSGELERKIVAVTASALGAEIAVSAGSTRSWGPCGR